LYPTGLYYLSNQKIPEDLVFHPTPSGLEIQVVLSTHHHLSVQEDHPFQVDQEFLLFNRQINCSRQMFWDSISNAIIDVFKYKQVYLFFQEVQEILFHHHGLEVLSLQTFQADLAFLEGLFFLVDRDFPFLRLYPACQYHLLAQEDRLNHDYLYHL
jgi:hypothetical protein